MKRVKKSRFWTFCFSFLPGAAEMYMGFMNMGVSLLTLFFASIFVAYFIDMGPLLCVTCIIWFYSFFHARNMARLTNEELEQVEDVYVVDFERISTGRVKNVFANQKFLAWVFIIIGAYMLWKGFVSTVAFILPDGYFWKVGRLAELIERLILGAIIVWFGLKLVQGKKIELSNFSNQEVAVAEIKETQEVTEEVVKVELSKATEDKEGEENNGGKEENA
ncbi:MAG: hypothetical protein IKL07_05880 [Clostridium sp.]|nr:hypothetical protein [Clostridium sp.]